MGKRRKRTTRKWRKKGAETGEEAHTILREKNVTGALQSMANDELFVIDKAGGEAGTAEPIHENEKDDSSPRAKQKRKLPRPEKKKVSRSEEDLCDLWAEKKTANSKKTAVPKFVSTFSSTRMRKKKAKVEKLLPTLPSVPYPDAGLSYHPSKDAHEEIMARVMAKEIARADRLASEKLPEVHPVVPVDDLDDENKEESDDDNDDETLREPKRSIVADNSTHARSKTTAQRNRAKRHRQVEAEIAERKRQRVMMHQINMSKKLLSEIEQKEKAREERRKTRGRLREEALAAPDKRTIVVGGKRRLLEPVSKVALTSELKGSLRLMKNNSNVLRDRWHSMLERSKFELGDKQRVRRLEKQQRRKYRPYGKSHWGVEALKVEAKKRAK
eukprot:g35.t1